LMIISILLYVLILAIEKRTLRWQTVQ